MATTPRTRLESFRLQQQAEGGPYESVLPDTTAAQPTMPAQPPSMPALSLRDVNAALPNPTTPRGSVTDRPLTSRRLKKEVLCADSSNQDGSNAAGHLTLLDEMGTPRSVRVVQQEAKEDFNMVSVKWLWTLDGRTHQIELRHGRLSGIRKIYVNTELIVRTKSIQSLLLDRGSNHSFQVAGKTAVVRIVAGPSAGFKYYLEIDEAEIEREIGISAPGLSIEIGTHFVTPQVERRGFGMTLANCGMRKDGVVIIELEPGLPAHQSGLLVGDVILSVDETTVVDTNVILEKLSSASSEGVSLEIAGQSPSRLMTVPNPFAGADNGDIKLNDTACGIGVYVAAVTPWCSDQPRGTGQLELGDVLLSVDGAVTESAKETTKYLKRGPPVLTFVVAGRALAGH